VKDNISVGTYKASGAYGAKTRPAKGFAEDGIAGVPLPRVAWVCE